ncbi:two-component system response regulator YesN [Mobilisporobacter senegalensis]|uniref:Stage 0 sporulation protein A homolog n=1 Tax=Mobilisporobacter senegalensis TaxID=1329262 RepID=A0A3N1XYM1_9FIRM|nr:response regulator [Mobilisporobacter senegalensis]ROR31705.1 two-component system response regulator YesN [Mobilisporobacter senegalensis]
MGLYRIMLVDDEEEVRTSIIKKVEWEKIGFQIIGDAENGREALEMAALLEPDVVITDIKMPFMDGLTLGEKLREILPSVKIVIFSGFDDFEFAKQAIKLNVVEYVLKPVNVEELTGILLKLKRNIDEEIKQKTDIEILRRHYVNSLPVIRERYLTGLLNRNITGKHYKEPSGSYKSKLDEGNLWAVSLLYIEAIEANEKKDDFPFLNERELIPFSIKQLADEKLENYSIESFFISDKLAIIAAFRSGDEIDGYIDALNDICKESKRIIDLNVTAGIGALSDNLLNLSISYEGAENALDYKMILGTGKAIYINDVEPDQVIQLQFDDQSERELLAVIKFGSEDEIKKMIDCLIGRFENVTLPFKQYQVYLLGIVSSIMKVVQGYELDMDNIFGSEIDYFDRLAAFQSADEIKQWFTTICINLSSYINKERTSTTKQIVKEAKQYILENYEDPLLSVETICEHLHISTAYFSTLFKKETGQSYVAYLTKVRLEKAVELLNTTDYKTYIISNKVGYAEPNYFSYVFKKQFGVSPSKFRGR